ncbi:SNARE associated Golgi protein [Kalmanozyma brasiliensis GHG001]|uniref:Golgi apparatus membrane protein TVP38 n=1 Tax=Kalmanozyma brasiliensis (strain GHG001) TaxID=1365824 RepID=V5EM81_KALBG|nr:SNARE associated Golgi protein [Kalmanozyma brasiliensis GHG001]EST06240.1 SNARE associated Golgi protein [Kalmanozyma brasiliensis GHG001]
MPTSPTHRGRYVRREASSSSRWRALYHRGHSYMSRAWSGFLSLPPEQRYILYLVVGIKFLILGVVLYIGPEVMFDTTAKLAIWFGSQTFGAALLIALVVIVSFPPLIGYGTCITLFGLGWGVHSPANADHGELNGNLFYAWALASVACLLGASVSFVVLRWAITHHAKRVSWISSALDDPKYAALTTAVRSRGLSMAILIRFCPFPFAYSNLFFASLLDAVPYRHFIAATALITPKLFLHVWLGTRMFVLMDRDQRAQLDGTAKALNVVYIAVGGAVGVATSWFVWRETSKVLDQIEREQAAERRNGAGGGEGRERSGSPYRDTPDANKATPPFVLDLGVGSDDEEDRPGLKRKDSARQSLLPR